ncbi:MAG: FCD domain-containing protein [Eubacteriales bacterium]
MSRKTSLTDTFVKQVEDKILSGEWPVGSRLPTARELSDIFHISRSVINAGMVELQARGFIKIVPRKWTEVIDYHKEGTLKVLESIMEYDRSKIDERLFISVLQARMLVEIQCAYLAAMNRTEEDIEILRQILDNEAQYRKGRRGAKAGSVMQSQNTSGLAHNDFSFHHSIAVASSNAVYPLILKSFEPMSIMFTKQFYQNENILQVVSKYHTGIFEAIKKRDGEKAKRLMEELLTHGENIIKDMVKKSQATE